MAAETESAMAASPVGKTKDAGWEIGAVRSFPVSVDEAWRFLSSPAGAAVWLGQGAAIPKQKGDCYLTDDGTIGELRGYRVGDRIRVTMRAPHSDHETTVQCTVSGNSEKTQIRFHQERMLDAREREIQRAHWISVLNRLADVFKTS